MRLKRFTAAFLSVVTAMSSVNTSYLTYASDWETEAVSIETLAETENGNEVEVSASTAEEPEEDAAQESSFETVVSDNTDTDVLRHALYFALTENGRIVTDPDTPEEKSLYKQEDEDGNVSVRMEDAEGKILHEVIPDVSTGYDYSLYETFDTIKDYTFVADEGYAIDAFVVLHDGEYVETDFEPIDVFTYTVNFEADTQIAVSFVPEDEISEMDTEVSTEDVVDVQIGTEEEALVEISALEHETEDVTESFETEDVTEAPIEIEAETEETEVLTEAVETEEEVQTEDVTEAPIEVEEETSSDIEFETEEPETEVDEYTAIFLNEETEGLDTLDASLFDSKRLIVVAPQQVIDEEHVIGQYGEIYFFAYETKLEAMNAYLYYGAISEGVEPDVEIGVADDEYVGDVEVTEDSNPILNLEQAEDSVPAQKADNLIALIDTGVSEHPNVVDRVSLIDDVLSGNGHGDEMVSAIVSQNEDAKILSIRAMGDNGRGSASSIIAAIEYAIAQDAQIINLSVYAKMSLTSSVVADEILKAINMGIIVVGAAGNDGADVINYIPGSIYEAFIIGAAKENGERLASSNYGETVDFNVVAGSTSEAAAKFTGYVSKNGTDFISVNDGLIYETNFVAEDTDNNITLHENEPYIVWQVDYFDWLEVDVEHHSGSEDYTAIDNCRIISYLLREDTDFYYFYANPFNEDIDEVWPHVVVAWSGSENNIFITDETIYDADAGIVGIPKICFDGSHYGRKDDPEITFGVGLLNNTISYRELIPDEIKDVNTPQEFRTAHNNMSYPIWEHTEWGSANWIATSQSMGTYTVSDTNFAKLQAGDRIGLSINSNGDMVFSDGGAGRKGTISSAFFAYTSDKSIQGKSTSALNGESVYGRCIDSHCPYGSESVLGWPKSAVGSASDWYTQIRVKNKTTSGDYIIFTCFLAAKVPGNQDWGLYLNIRVKKDSSGKVKVKKSVKSGTKYLTKLANGSTNPLYSLKGTVITLYDSEKKSVGTFSIEEDGTSKTTLTVESGTYYWKETKVPIGYKIGKATNQFNKITVSDGETTTINVENEPISDPEAISINKIGSDGNIVAGNGSLSTAGTKFRIQYWAKETSGSTVPSGSPDAEWIVQSKASSNGGSTVKLTSKDYFVSGSFPYPVDSGNIVTLPVGTYLISEDAPASGFVATTGTFLMHITRHSSGTNAYSTLFTAAGSVNNIVFGNSSVSVSNDVAAPRKIRVHKQDSVTGESLPQGDGTLANIGFDVINRSAYPVTVVSGGKKYTYKVGAVIAVAHMTTDANGNATTPVDLPPGTYAVKESSTNTYYDLTDSGEHSVAIPNNSSQETVDAGIWKNKPRYGSLAVNKVSSVTQKATPDGNATLEGAVYKVVNASARRVVATDGVVLQPHGDLKTKDTAGTIAWSDVNAIPDSDSILIKTNSKGEARTAAKYLPYGTYYIIEKTPSTGYKQNEVWVGKVVINAQSEFKAVTVTNGKNAANESLATKGSSIAPEEPVMGDLAIQKIDARTGQPVAEGDASLKGIQFAVYNASNNAVTVLGVSYQKGAEIQKVRLTTDDKGYATTKGMRAGGILPYGSYEYQEIATNGSYLLTDGSRKSFVIDGTTDLVSKEQGNEPRMGGVIIEKIDFMLFRAADHGNANMSGAKFAIVNASDNAIMMADGSKRMIEPTTSLKSGNPSYTDVKNAISKSLVYELETNRAGTVRTPTSRDLPYGTYYIIETAAPTGYALNTEWVGKVVISEDNKYVKPTSVGSAPTPVQEPIFRGGLSVDKIDLMLHAQKDHGDTNLSGAEFTIVNASEALVKNKDGKEIPTSKLSGNVAYAQVQRAVKQYGVQVITTDRKGHAQTGDHDLPYGTYYVIETKAATGYFLNMTWVGKITVEKDGTIYSAKTVVASEDDDVAQQIWRGGLWVNKLDIMLETTEAHGDTNLSGAEFTIVNSSLTVAKNKDGKEIPTASLGDNPTYAQVKAKVGESTMQVLTTDATGYAQTGDHDLPYGTYYVIETKPATGYFLNETWVGKVIVREDGKLYEPTSLNDKKYTSLPGYTRQQIWRGGLWVNKIDVMRNSTDPHGDTDLSGAEFTIVNASQSLIMNKDKNRIPTSGIGASAVYAQVAKAAEKSKVQVITTDKKGYAQTGDHDLPYGTYYVIETKPATGYFLNTSWVGKVVVREDGVLYEVEPMGDTKYEDYPSYTRQQIYRSGVMVRKIDYEMKDAIRQGEAVLSGAEFTIINASKTVVRNKDDVDIPTSGMTGKPTWKQLKDLADDGSYTVQTIVTDKNGIAKTGYHDLPYGTYYIIETKSSFGYFLDDKFVGKIVVRDDGLLMSINDVEGDSYFKDLNDESHDLYGETVDQQVHRGDIYMMKVNIDGEYKPYIPFMVSAVRVNADGTETVLESHVIVSDENGIITTASEIYDSYGNKHDAHIHSNHTNEFDQYVVNGIVTEEGEALLKEASTWGVWFQGNSNDYPKDYLRDDYGSLYTCHYRVTELHCNDNKDLEENLLNTDLIFVDNTLVTLEEPMARNDQRIVYHPLVDTEIVLESVLMDVDSNTKTTPVREENVVKDTIRYTHVSSDHQYRMETKFVDITTGQTLRVLGSPDENTSISDDGVWLQTQFQPKKQSGTNNTWGSITVQGIINTMGREGHEIMAYDYLYEYVDITGNDFVPGNWILVAHHPVPGEIDPDQCVYIPDLITKAHDTITGNREGAKNADDGILDTVKFMNLSTNEQYVIVMTLVDTKTGEPIVKDENGEAVTVKSKTIFRRGENPIEGEIEMPEFKLDSSAFENNQSVTVVEQLYMATEDGEPMGEPIVSHDSLMDEDQTIRWPDVYTTASDKNTTDDVGTSEKDAVVYDMVKLENLVFDDDDHELPYSYTVRGTLRYQKDFTDANGVAHKEGEIVETLDGTQDVVTVTGDAAGNLTFTYPDGTVAEGRVLRKNVGMNVAKRVDESRKGDNSYIADSTCSIIDAEVELIYHVDSSVLEGGTVVVFEKLYHDSANLISDVEVAKHEDINDEGQTVHYLEVKTSALDTLTLDDVGGVRKDAVIVDTVRLKNLVPGRDYTVSGILMDQDTGDKFLMSGKEVRQSASVHVTEDGKLETGNGEKAVVTSYNEEKHEVCGTVDLTFTFDASLLENRTTVVFEDLIHNGVTVAVHEDITDQGQTVHFPEIRTTLTDGYTKDHVGTVVKEAVVHDDVKYKNLVIGREYTVSGVLMDKETGEAFKDAAGNTITQERTFVAGETGDGLTVTSRDEEKGRVDGTVRLTFTFEAIEDTTVVAFERLIHNGKEVTTHTDITDEDQSVHFPKVRTSAHDGNVGDEVGLVGETKIVDTVKLWNLLPGMTYEVSGVLMDKATNEPLLVNGEQQVAKATVTVGEDGTLSGNGCDNVTVSRYDTQANRVDGSVDLTFVLDASTLAGKTSVVFEDLLHNDGLVAFHHDINDLGQSIHFPEIRTNATDADTGTGAGTVKKDAVIVDVVTYENLVIGKEYTLSGTLMNQETSLPVIDTDGSVVTTKVTFVAGEEEEGVNKVTARDEQNWSVDGTYTLKFKLDASVLAGKTIVVFEDLIHNDVTVRVHHDIEDDAQSVHFPQIRTTAVDIRTGDHVGTIFGSLVNSVRRLFGQDIEEDERQTILDTVEVDNLNVGLTYVISGKIYDVNASRKEGRDVPLVINGEEITSCVRITVSEDGKITASNGEKTIVTKFDEKTGTVNGTIVLPFVLDGSLADGRRIVVYEKLYQDVTYDETTVPEDVDEEDLIHEHSDLEDEGQSVDEIQVRTTAIDADTKDHIGTVPQEGRTSVISDSVNMEGLRPGMEYTIEGVLVDMMASDFEGGKPMYLKADGTLTEDRSEAYTESTTFVAEHTAEVHQIHFSIASDYVMGRTFTVFEDLLHAGVLIAVHPGKTTDGGWDEDQFSSQTVYYPTGKTNATDDVTTEHISLAGERTVTDRVYFENLLAGSEYTITGRLVYKDGTNAGADASEERSVTFTAAKDLEDAAYEDGDGAAKFDSVTSVDLPDGNTVISGYVSLTFTVTAEEGRTYVAFEDFYHEGTPIFVHHDLTDLPQTVKVPKIRTNAKSLDLDEAAVFDANGGYRDIEIVDTVSYENLWTTDELVKMSEDGKHISYEDGTVRDDGPIYEIDEKALYVLKGVLMDKETGEALTNENGGTYVVYSEPFEAKEANGSEDITFVVNAGDFVKDDVTVLEGKTAVVFEDLYLYKKADGEKPDTSDTVHVGEHHDIEDDEQDIRFPKGRTHAVDGEQQGSDHEEDGTVSVHESWSQESMTVTDSVSFENLHGATVYTVTGTLQVITEFDENGVPTAWEEAVDDNGEVITSTRELDTTIFSSDYEGHVSGHIQLTFTFPGLSLAGKTLVAFETISRNGIPVMVHADIKDEAQTVYIPKIGTKAYDLLTGVDEMLASDSAVIIDKVSYENLADGVVYEMEGILHDTQDGEALVGAETSGKFVAGAENQYITPYGTFVFSDEEAKEALKALFAETSDKKAEELSSDATGKRTDGAVYVVIPAASADLAGHTLVAFEKLYSYKPVTEEGEEPGKKPVASHEDISDEEQSVHIPKIRTNAKSGELDEASVHDGENGYREITIIDTVTYENLTVGRSYKLKGILMDKATGEPLTRADGGIYEVITEAFVPEQADGTYDMTFTVNAGDFVVDGVNTLEAKTAVVFEDLYICEDGKDLEDDNHTAEHHDINDTEQDIRFPKGRTHAVDGDKALEDTDSENGYVHEAYAKDTVTVTDLVSFENLHGGTVYTVTGRLQMVTEYQDGKPSKWESAKDKDGNEIVATKELDTSALDEDFNASVSGTIELTFEVPSDQLAGKTLVAFETISREDTDVIVHANINDEAQTVYIPKIGTKASEAFTGMDEMLAEEGAVIVDEVMYENLEEGRTYKMEAQLVNKADGKAVGDTVIGTFVAGTDSQYIFKDSTKTMSREEFVKSLGDAKEAVSWAKDEKAVETKEAAEIISGRAHGSVYVVLPVDASKLAGETVVAFEKLYAVADSEDNEAPKEDKQLASHEDLEDEAQTVTIPKIGTKARVDGKQEVDPDAEIMLVDTVSYENLVPGRKYVMHGVLMDKESGKALDVTATEEFTPKEASGEMEMSFKFKTTDLAGKTIVAFEECASYNAEGKPYVVAEHKDLEDKEQSITVRKKPEKTPMENPSTGDRALPIILFGSAVIAILALVLVWMRRRRVVH